MRSRTTRSTSALALALAAAALALSGCGDDSPSAAPTTATLPTPATVPSAGPPPAVAQTSAGRVTMAPFGGCWRDDPASAQVCGDPAWPTCPDPDLPVLPAAPGDDITFRLATAAPSELRLSSGNGATSTPLKPSLNATWSMDAPYGPLVLRAVIPGRGDPAWAACLVPQEG